MQFLLHCQSLYGLIQLPILSMAPGKESGKLDIDRLPFYGIKLPPNMLALKKVAGKLDRSTFQKLLRLAVSAVEGKSLKSEQVDSLVTDTIPLETIHIAYAGLLKTIQAAFRCSAAALSKEQFIQDLSSLNLTKEMVEDLSSAVFGSRRAVLEAASVSNAPRKPTIVDFKWRIDVGISTTSLNRVLEPVVAVSMTLSNGEVKNFEMSVPKFQELRYNVATVMKEMEDLEKRSILKIQD